MKLTIPDGSVRSQHMPFVDLPCDSLSPETVKHKQ